MVFTGFRRKSQLTREHCSSSFPQPVCSFEPWEHCTRKTMTTSEASCFENIFSLLFNLRFETGTIAKFCYSCIWPWFIYHLNISEDCLAILTMTVVWSITNIYRMFFCGPIASDWAILSSLSNQPCYWQHSWDTWAAACKWCNSRGYHSILVVCVLWIIHFIDKVGTVWRSVGFYCKCKSSLVQKKWVGACLLTADSFIQFWYQDSQLIPSYQLSFWKALSPKG